MRMVIFPRRWILVPNGQTLQVPAIPLGMIGTRASREAEDRLGARLASPVQSEFPWGGPSSASAFRSQKPMSISRYIAATDRAELNRRPRECPAQ